MEQNFDKALAKNGSVIGLLDLLMDLDRVKPYLELSKNGEIKEYFEKKGISEVVNKKQLASFYNALENKITDLADSDERARLYFEKREYLKQLDSLPQKLSQLENLASSGFDGLKAPFKAVMSYVWNAVIEDGFEMKEGDFKLAIKKVNNLTVSFYFPDIYSNTHAYYFHLLKTGESKKEKIGEGFLGRPKYKLVEQVNPNFFVQALVEEYFLHGFWDWGDSAFNTNSYTVSLDKFVENLKDIAVENLENMEKIKDFIRIILGLPKRMNKYLNKKERGLKGLFNGAKSLGEEK
jgi:hypothetical protein